MSWGSIWHSGLIISMFNTWRSKHTNFTLNKQSIEMWPAILSAAMIGSASETSALTECITLLNPLLHHLKTPHTLSLLIVFVHSKHSFLLSQFVVFLWWADCCVSFLTHHPWTRRRVRRSAFWHILGERGLLLAWKQIEELTWKGQSNLSSFPFKIVVCEEHGGIVLNLPSTRHGPWTDWATRVGILRWEE